MEAQFVKTLDKVQEPDDVERKRNEEVFQAAMGYVAFNTNDLVTRTHTVYLILSFSLIRTARHSSPCGIFNTLLVF